MGYYMNNRAVEGFIIKEENIEKAVKALNDLGKSNIKLSWVDSCELARSKNIVDLMNECRWSGFINDDEDFELEYFTGEKYGSDETIFTFLAPYVEDGAFIEMQGEEGELWRWVFTDGTCKEKVPKIIWE